MRIGSDSPLHFFRFAPPHFSSPPAVLLSPCRPRTIAVVAASALTRKRQPQLQAETQQPAPQTNPTQTKMRLAAAANATSAERRRGWFNRTHGTQPTRREGQGAISALAAA